MKKKLVSGIITGVLALGLLVVGVYAVIKAGMTFSGGVAFNPNGVYIELSGQVYRGKNVGNLDAIYEDKTYTLQTSTNYSEEGTKTLPAWKPNNVIFTPIYRCVQYKISIKNLSSEDISVIPNEIEWVNGSTSSDVDVFEEASATLRIPCGATRDYKLNFVLSSNAINFSNKDFSIILNVVKTSDIPTPSDSCFTMSGTQLQKLNTTAYSTTAYGKRVLRVPDKVGSNQVLSTKDGSSSDFTFGNLTSETKYVIMPSGLTSLGADAFSERQLQAIGLPDTLLIIGQTAFRSSGLKSLFLPKNVNTLGWDVLVSCYNVVGLDVDKDNATFYSDNLNAIVKRSSEELVVGCQFSNIKEGIVSIGDAAFDGCQTLKEIKFPSTLKNIKANAFWGCYGLTEVIIPDTVQTIGDYAFRSLINCETLKIGAGVTSIGENAISNWQKLKSVTIDSSTIAKNITSKSSQGAMLEYCEYIYTKNTISVSSIYAMQKLTTSDKTGYNKWQRIVTLSEKGEYKLSAEQTFTGSSSTIPYFDNSFQYQDKITISIWAYRSSWAAPSKDNTLMSCTNDGGWNIVLESSGRIRWACMFLGEEYNYRDFVMHGNSSNLASGWHMFTITFDGRYVKLYVDASVVGTSDLGSTKTIRKDVMNKPIVIGGECAYSSDSSILVDGDAYYNGKLKGALIDNVVFDAAKISSMYNVVRNNS